MGMQRRTPLWLSHHYPHEYDRCIRVGDSHICRRCTVFYPVVFAVMFATLADMRWPQASDAWLLWLLPVPVVTEWSLEHLGTIRYSAGRNTTLTLICAPAVGVGLARYMASPGDTLFWSVVAAYAVICIIPVVLNRKFSRQSPPSGTTPPANAESRYRTGAGSAR